MNTERLVSEFSASNLEPAWGLCVPVAAWLCAHDHALRPVGGLCTIARDSGTVAYQRTGDRFPCVVAADDPVLQTIPVQFQHPIRRRSVEPHWWAVDAAGKDVDPLPGLSDRIVEGRRIVQRPTLAEFAVILVTACLQYEFTNQRSAPVVCSALLGLVTHPALERDSLLWSEVGPYVERVADEGRVLHLHAATVHAAMLRYAKRHGYDPAAAWEDVDAEDVLG